MRRVWGDDGTQSTNDERPATLGMSGMRSQTMSETQSETEYGEVRVTESGYTYRVTETCVVCDAPVEGKGGMGMHLEQSDECRNELLKRLTG